MRTIVFDAFEMTLNGQAVNHLAKKSFFSIANAFGEGRYGACLYYGFTDGRLIEHCMLGRPDPGDWETLVPLSLEKAHRLSQHPEHVSSAKSRDLKERKYAGAIRLPYFQVLSLAGLPDLASEAYVTAMALHLRWIGPEIASKIMDVTENNLQMREMLSMLQRIEPIPGR